MIENNDNAASDLVALTQLKKGERGVVSRILDEALMASLMEMGCLPGEVLEVCQIAPLSGPVAIKVSGYKLSIRKSDAAAIMVSRI